MTARKTERAVSSLPCPQLRSKNEKAPARQSNLKPENGENGVLGREGALEVWAAGYEGGTPPTESGGTNTPAFYILIAVSGCVYVYGCVCVFVSACKNVERDNCREGATTPTTT